MRLIGKWAIIITALICLTVFDCLAYPLNDMWVVGELYQNWKQAFTFLILAWSILVGLATHSPTCMAAFLLLAWSGAEDILFFLFMGWPLPARWPWLDDAILIWPKPVSLNSLIISTILWGMIAMLLTYLEHLEKAKREDALWDHFW